MRVFYSTDSDPMILDSVSNLKSVYSKLVKFLDADNKKIRIEAIISGSPEPYSEFLPYLEFSKTQGKVTVQFIEGNGLLISGSKKNLAIYIEAFKFGEGDNGNHHHPEFSLINENNFEMGGLWPFVEADNEYVVEHKITES